ncbi:Uncharacterised protein [Mycobacterium tuberculosis]|nr:Uncharacterised protein [Mycobacterium tuberculosis]CMI27641.1 Uncharacterised protein [Mycobacterium tuberculosis]
MEKVIAVLMRPEPDDDWCARQRAQVADALLGLGVAGLSINVRDSTVRDSLMTLTTLYPPVAAVVSLWTQQCYGEQVAAALRLLAQECDELGAYLVTESVPLTFPSLVESGSRTPGLANNLSAPTIRGRGWSTASDCGCYSARSSLRRVARTTTGTSTTG